MLELALIHPTDRFFIQVFPDGVQWNLDRSLEKTLEATSQTEVTQVTFQMPVECW